MYFLIIQDRLASEESNHYEFLIDFYGGIVTSLIEVSSNDVM